MRAFPVQVFLFLLLVFPFAGLSAANGFVTLVPDNSLVRQAFKNAFIEPLGTLLGQKNPGTVSSRDNPLLPYPVSVSFRRDKDGKTVSLWFENQSPRGMAGTVRIRRDWQSGAVVDIAMYLDADGKTVALLEPLNPAATGITVRILGRDLALYRRVRMALPIENYLQMPVHRMMELSASRIDWYSLLWTREAALSAPLQVLEKAVDARIGSLPVAFDGAMDEHGRLVTIKDSVPLITGGFQCSGFAKWVVDGYYHALVKENPQRAPFLSVPTMKARMIDVRGNERHQPFEESRDPYFGLDWTRNLALAVAMERGELVRGPESRDFRDSPVVRYVEDKGYPVQFMEQVLYLEAIRNPGRFYLLSFNGERSDKLTLVLWQHHHVVVALPYFDQRGNFRLACYEYNGKKLAKTPWGQLQARFGGYFVHPVWLDADVSFELPPIPQEP